MLKIDTKQITCFVDAQSRKIFTLLLRVLAVLEFLSLCVKLAYTTKIHFARLFQVHFVIDLIFIVGN